MLHLTANQLPDVPAEISYLYNLTHLHLNANRITSVAKEVQCGDLNLYASWSLTDFISWANLRVLIP